MQERQGYRRTIAAGAMQHCRFREMLRSNKPRGWSTTDASNRFQESRCGFDSRAPS
jgi:hypothetical protein